MRGELRYVWEPSVRQFLNGGADIMGEFVRCVVGWRGGGIVGTHTDYPEKAGSCSECVEIAQGYKQLHKYSKSQVQGAEGGSANPW